MEYPTVTTKQGLVKGKIGLDIRGNKFCSFQGIPYAQPPLGNLRFRAPQPAKKWKGVLDATKIGLPCLQKNTMSSGVLGSEDCLHLNVYTPELPHKKSIPKPVMVFIHGGAFVSGSNTDHIYGPEFLIAEDIVLVVINYRLGILGFLHLKDAELGVPGNAAFKDMVLALKWVQENIQNFNGDPNNVTIFGESAGAAAVHALMLSPMTKGLFHKVIAQSGCILNGWSHGHYNAKSLCKQMGLDTEDEKSMLKFLQKSTTEDLYRGQQILEDEDVLTNTSRYVGLVIEKPHDEPAFMPEHPMDIMLKGNHHKVPIIMGYNNNEGIIFDVLIAKEKQDKYWMRPEINIPASLQIDKKSALARNIGEKIIKFYCGDGIIDKEIHAQNIYDMTTDNCFLCGIYTSVKIHARNSNESVYLYRMTVESDLNMYKNISGINVPGVYHADDIGYLFKTAITPEITPDSLEDISQRRFAKLWTNFAKFSNPTPPQDNFLCIKWPEVSENSVTFLDIGEDLKLEKDPEPARMQFWDSIYNLRPVASKL